MPSRLMFWFLGAALLGVLAVTWWAGSYPAQLTIMNASGTALEKLTITTDDVRIEVATLASGEFRRFSLRPGGYAVLRCAGKTWQSRERLAPAQSVVLYISPGPRFEERTSLGTLAR